ncbi:FeS assembly protein SufD [Serratia symbiotica str. 'Cinara cedri']|nr:FeS assembly protein SufD [Serratia symbiotica str. 'Cinara cedri']
MAGLLNNERLHVLQQWSNLFKCGSEKHTAHALTHWQQVQHLCSLTCKDENWKHVPLKEMCNQEFTTPLSEPVTIVQRDTLALNIDAYRLVFINGQFNAMLSDSYLGEYLFELVTNDTVHTLSAQPVQSEIFLHLTESLAKEISIIHLPCDKKAARPLYLLHISSGKKTKNEVSTVHYRHHLKILPRAQAEVIEHYVSLDDAEHFTGARLTANIANNSKLLHYKLAFENKSSYHFSHNDLVINSNAQVKSDNFLLGTRLTRHNISSQFNSTGANLKINSLVLPIGKEVCDIRTYIEHNQGYCNSDQLHKTIVSDQAKAVFHGIINVAKKSIKTNGNMTNRNLLLGKDAEVNTKPELEIYADDVKCSHGATVGSIDVAQLFYMQSRGINKQDAQQMIIVAFSAELTANILNKTLRESVINCITQRLPRESA